MPKIVDHQARREAVAEIAARLIAECGIEGTTLREVARRASCSTSIVSHYFRDKHDLLLSAYRLRMTRTNDRVREQLAAGAPLQDCLASVLPLDRELMESWRIWLAFWGLAATDPELMAEQRQRSREAVELFHDLILAHSGLAATVETRLAAQLILGSISGIAAQAVYDPERWTPECQRRILGLQIGRLLPRPAPGGPAVAALEAGDLRSVRAPQPRGEARRQAIMDAAEAVFAERGYYGSSLREVSARCGSAIGLIAHHFPTKEQLFRAVVDRKLDRLTAIVDQSLADSIAAGQTTSRDMVRAFIAPFLTACARNDAEIRNYIRLTSHFMSAYTVPELRTSLQSLLPVSALFTRRLRALMPDMDERDFRIGAYLIEAALIFMVQDNGFLEALSDGVLPMDRIAELIDPAATFFDGGLAALAGRSVST